MANVERMLEQAREILAIAHWVALAALAVFAASLFLAVPSLSYAVSAVFIGVVYFFGTIMVWRRRNRYAFVILFTVFFWGAKVAESLESQAIKSHLMSFIFFVQWSAILIIVVFALIALFRTRVTRYCRLAAPSGCPGVPPSF